MDLDAAYAFMDQRILEGYTPRACAKWYRKLFEMFHGADPTRACQLSCTMVDFREEMGLDKGQGGDLYVEALQSLATRWTTGSIYIYGAWCAHMVSSKDIEVQLARIEQQNRDILAKLGGER